jgi:macrolide transport system ATP-binding/permease protein
MREAWRRLHWLLHRDRFEREIDEEMRHHLALKAEEQGSTEAAQKQFGNITLLKEDSRTMWIGTFWEQLEQDVRYGLRNMAAHKLFSAMAVLSLALGIGANTAIYSFMDAIMLKAMPVRHPEELAIVNWHVEKESSPVIRSQTGSNYDDPGGLRTSPNYPYPAYEFLRDNNNVFSSLFAYANAGRLNLVIDGQAELGEGEYCSGGYFSGLGIIPAAGRLIDPDDDRHGAPPVVAITYGFWQRRFGGRSDAVGKSILLNGKPFTIVGVAAPQFFGVRPQSAPVVFIPVRQLGLVDSNRFGDVEARFTDSHFYWIEMMGRLRPGVSLTQAQTELGGKFQGWVTGTAATEKERANLPALWVQEGGSGVDSLRRQYSKPLYILMAMVGLILMIACANIANLLLTRAEARRREMAVRLSLGAGRLRVIRQLLTESLLLSFCAGLLGIFLAEWGIRSLTWLLANGRENFSLHAELDWRVLTFTLLVALATGVLFGLAPAIQATKVEITPALKESRANVPRGRMGRFGTPFGLSHLLVVSQIAISLLLVAAAGLFVRTLNNLESVQLGFNRENVLLFSLNGALAGYKGSSLKSLYAELQRRFRSLPAVRGATVTTMPLVANYSNSTDIIIPGVPKAPGRGPDTSVIMVGPAFFETMQIPILLGRPIDERDRDGAPISAVVNEVFAKKYFPGESPVGRHFGFGRKEPVDVEIAGIARTARYNSLKQEIPPVAYISYLQTIKTWPVNQIFFELRTVGDPLAMAKTVRQIVHEVSPNVPVADITTQSRQIDGTIIQERTFAELCTCFGVLALVMACLGLYGTMAYAVSRRTSEIGIRMALGAERRWIIWMVLKQVLVLGAVGVVVGMAAVWETTAFLKSFLFGLQPNDPMALGGAVAILAGCAVLAGYAPALRASRIDPMAALRHE